MDAQRASTFTISIPRERDFAVVAGLVVGGIAARHDVTLDVLDDLQLALDSLFERAEDDEGEISVVLRIGDDRIDVAVGPVRDETVAELEREADEGLGLRRLLETTVDDVSVSERDGQAWVELRKACALAGADG